jgi:hypothetical protein
VQEESYLFVVLTEVNDERKPYPAIMRGRNKNAQNGETFEIASPLEDGGNIPATDGRAGNEGYVDEKKGNEDDQRHMLRLGKTPELRVSGHHHQHRLFAIY